MQQHAEAADTNGSDRAVLPGGHGAHQLGLLFLARFTITIPITT
jgi:hypothetical protein